MLDMQSLSRRAHICKRGVQAEERFEPTSASTHFPLPGTAGTRGTEGLGEGGSASKAAARRGLCVLMSVKPEGAGSQNRGTVPGWTDLSHFSGVSLGC